MNKIFFIIVLLVVLFFSSCSIDWNNEKEQKLVELEKQISDMSFERNKECLNLIPNLEKRIIEKNEASNINTYELIEVFYSKEKKDCLWVLKQNKYLEDYSSTMYFLIKSWNIWYEWNLDRCLWATYFHDSSKDSNNCAEFNERVRQLKL